MPLFRSRKKEVSPVSPSSSPPKLSSRSSSVRSNESASSAKFKLFKKKDSAASSPAPITPPVSTPDRLQLREKQPYVPDRLKKRVSTIVEADNDDYKGSGSESEYDSSDSEGSGNLDTYSFDTSEIDESSGDESEDFEEHTHAIKARGKVSSHQFAAQLSTIMGYCGVGSKVSNKDQLKIQANEESKRTYSLINGQHKIHQLPNSTTSTQSVIDTYQIELIDYLRSKSSTWLKACKVKSEEASITAGKTLFERYGVVSDIVGKGAYGVIKVIDRNPEGSTIELAKYNNVLYAVKEIQRRSNKESNESFIERVISEFVISSTLNNKHIVKTVDLMVTVPFEKSGDFRNLKFNQVMECTTGGDLFTYLTTVVDKNSKPVNFMSLDEIDCFIKQISKGLKYMHQHGVAHCDLKLENILLTYKDVIDKNGTPKAKIVLKISDYGKSNVFRTKYDTAEQFLPRNQGPIGSEPYMAPEEHADIKSYSLVKKDCWSLGILILVLFNIRRHYFSGSSKIEYITSAQIEDSDNNNVHHDEHPGKHTLIQEYSSGYLWQTTDLKHQFSVNNEKKYKDKVFDEYTRTRMISDYDPKTKEWLVKKQGGFKPVEELFWRPRDQSGENDKRTPDEDDLSELRRMFIYKLLDLDPYSRPTVDQFLKSDWMTSVENCV